MVRIAAVLFALIFSLTSLASDCVNTDELDYLNVLIAKYQAKLGFVEAGYNERRSGLSNRPEVLESEIEELVSRRESLLQTLFENWKQCVRDHTDIQPLPAECPECDDKQTAYEEAIEKYFAKLDKVEEFQREYRLENLSAYEAEYERVIANQKKLKQALRDFRDLQDKGDVDASTVDRVISFYAGLLGGKSKAQKFAKEVLEPLVKERNRLIKTVPNTGANFNGPNTPADAEAMLSALKRLEQQLEDAKYVRESALDALINCNLRRCRVAQSANDLFMPGGRYGPPEGSSGWDGTIESEALTAPNVDAETTTRLSNNGFLKEPNFDSLVIADDISIDVPEIPADVQKNLVKLAENEDIYIPPQPCELNPPQLCQHLDATLKEKCIERFTNNNRSCKQFQARVLNADPLAACNGTCDYTELARIDGIWLLDQIFHTIDLRVESKLESSEAAETSSLRNQLRQLRLEQTNLQRIPETRKHLIYRNTRTGRTFEHFGTFFEPQAPLEYVGTEQGKRTQTENDRISMLPNLIFQLEKKLSSITLADTQLIDWADQAKSQWQRLMPCTIEEIPQRVAMCRNACGLALTGRKDRYLWTTTFCDPAGVIGFLHDPSSKIWIYPPRQ